MVTHSTDKVSSLDSDDMSVLLTDSHQRQGRVDEAFKPKYDKLCDIRNKLEKLSLTHAWSLRETDLFGYQRELDRIDETRVNGNFVDDEGNPADLFAQRVSNPQIL